MATQPLHAVCVRRDSASISDVISKEIVPLLAEKLRSLASSPQSASSDMRTIRQRVALEFYYEKTNDDPWGDHAKWNIVETDIQSKTAVITKHHFPHTEF
jgi:hypothetical protein